MLNQNRIDLCKYRLNTALEDYEAAIDMIKNQKYKAANNRAYYAIFHSLRAVLALENIDFKKHSAVIAYFNLHYIKTGNFKKQFYKIISNASEIRNECDYADFYIATKEEAETQAANAKEFYKAVAEFIKDKINSGTGS